MLNVSRALHTIPLRIVKCFRLPTPMNRELNFCSRANLWSIVLWAVCRSFWAARSCSNNIITDTYCVTADSVLRWVGAVVKKNQQQLSLPSAEKVQNAASRRHHNITSTAAENYNGNSIDDRCRSSRLRVYIGGQHTNTTQKLAGINRSSDPIVAATDSTVYCVSGIVRGMMADKMLTGKIPITTAVQLKNLGRRNRRVNRVQKLELFIQFSQGSAVTDLRWGARFYSSFSCSSSENATWCEKSLKLIHICQSYCKNKTCTLYMDHSVDIGLYCTVTVRGMSDWV